MDRGTPAADIDGAGGASFFGASGSGFRGFGV